MPAQINLSRSFALMNSEAVNSLLVTAECPRIVFTYSTASLLAIIKVE